MPSPLTHRMRFLLVVKQKRNVDTFLGTLQCLVDRGHTVTLAIQERDEKTEARANLTIHDPAFRVTTCPAVRTDEWSETANLVRRLRDCVHYLKPAMRAATKLRARIIHRLRQDLQFEATTDTVSRALLDLPTDQVQRLEQVLALAEQSLPADPLFDEFLRWERPDVLLVSPLVHFGPAQSDLVASATRMDIPAWMLLYSWDNLSTKGTLHQWPDRMFVWNEQQRHEAEELHGYPGERVNVIGAPRFDTFFSLRPMMTREQFHEPLGLDPARSTLLYVCSSRFVSEGELAFIRRWLDELRASASDVLRRCNVVIRPHPDIALLPADFRMPRHRWSAAPDLVARAARPFEDDRAVVLQTDMATPQGLYESIVHSDAVVGLNTTAELEAGIVGRPVFTVVADDSAIDGQSGTLHFHYLTKEQGGFVSSAPSFAAHLLQLDAALSRPPDPRVIRQFIQSFLRPHGIDRPVAPIFAETLERLAADATPSPAQTAAATRNPTELTAVRKSGIPPLRPPRPPHIEDLQDVDWLEQHVGFGDVIYEIGAGSGDFVITAVKRRSATVVAFEAGYAAYAELCENVQQNGCEASVVPVPLALAARDGLAEIRYAAGSAGQPGYAVRDDIAWRVKHRGANVPYFQPACLTRLDTAVERYRMPAPQHLRFSSFVSPLPVLRGASSTLAGASLKSIAIHVSVSEEAQVIEALVPLGWEVQSRGEPAADVRLILVHRAQRD
jgi:FkbM family methyltransferase